jgi:hypothetical protein
MASFIARSLDYLVAADVLVAWDFGRASATQLQLTDTDAGEHDDFDRAAFTVEGDDGNAGWRIRYVDDAVQHGSGHSIDVEGDAVLEITLKGMSPPADAEEDLDVHLDGDRIVEIVDSGWYEGYHQIFVGTTDELRFGADRLFDDEQVVYLDVFDN